MISANEAREEIALLTARIERLKFILDSRIYNVKLIFFTGTEFPGQFNHLDNTVIPFSLEGELRLLIADSISELERQRQSFETYL
jgi:hypothetical protein